MSENNNQIIPGGAAYRAKVLTLLGKISGENGSETEIIPGGAAFRARVVSLLEKIAENAGGSGGGGGANFVIHATVGEDGGMTTDKKAAEVIAAIEAENHVMVTFDENGSTFAGHFVAYAPGVDTPKQSTPYEFLFISFNPSSSSGIAPITFYADKLDDNLYISE